MIDEETLHENISEPSLFERLARIFVVTLLIIGLVYLSGIYQFFFYQRTPASFEQTPTEQRVAADQIVLPLEISVFTATEFGGSTRDEGDIKRLVANASLIWDQAAIALDVAHFERVYLDAAELRSLRRDPVRYLAALPATPGGVRAFFVHDLAGINGIAYGGIGTIAVADHTSVFDFRVLAHEVGHVLGLGHVADPQRLMFSGANGTKFTAEEIEQARLNATILTGS